MENQLLIKIYTTEKKEYMGDMFGIFFEDLNHAADGGLYAEMIRNRSFEFDQIDNKSYNHLTAWSIEGISEKDYRIETQAPVSEKNPHYLTLNTNTVGCLTNEGFGQGLYIVEGKKYNLSLYANVKSSDMELLIAVEDENGAVTEEEKITVLSSGWNKYESVLTGNRTAYNGKLKIRFSNEGTISLDHVSMFPQDTFLGKKNGLRADIAQMLKELKPKFMRFPGGCLVHDGSLDADARDSMYRWKNTIGDVIKRPARKSNWGYNQTLGLGYYEYFCFSEEIGAKPLPVLPGGYNPHRQAKVPIDELEPWVQETLDLIEFANGDTDTVWGKIRAELGHEKPFNLEYIAIGNEEVGEAFFERYPYFHKAIREKYPEIKIIGTSGPFQAGGEFERGWNSARENHADLVDEHYYMAPEWFLANMNRYSTYDPDGPKVFLGEYATWGNTYYNALVEAAYMVKMQENAATVSLACYAPLLCNVDYVNWKPDLIWFNNHQVYGTANYYVQKMFMNNNGDYHLKTKLENVKSPKLIKDVEFSGKLELEAVDGEVLYSGISVIDNETGKIYTFEDKVVSEQEKVYSLMETAGSNYTIKLQAKQLKGKKGFWIDFARTGEGDRLYWELGGWQNLDAAICQQINGRGACLTQCTFSVDYSHTYDLEIRVNRDASGDTVECYMDGKLFQKVSPQPVVIEQLYVTSSVEDGTGDIIVKAVNVKDREENGKIFLEGIEDRNYTVNIEEINGVPLDSENSFENPKKVSPAFREMQIKSNTFEYTFPKESVTIFRIKK